jgi:hypothetical protein
MKLEKTKYLTKISKDSNTPAGPSVDTEEIYFLVCIRFMHLYFLENNTASKI